MARRKAAKQARAAGVGTFDDVLNMTSITIAGLKCCNGILWKPSAQNYHNGQCRYTATTLRLIREGKWHPKTEKPFSLKERGKARTINAPHIKDRAVYRPLCGNAIVPVYMGSIIKNNFACLEGRGYLCALQSVEHDLLRHYAKYGRAGWYVRADFDDYFASGDHAYIKDRHHELLQEPELCAVADTIIDSCGTGKGKGLPLGVQLSQIEMTAYASYLDNYMKCQVGLDGYGRYMDDVYMLVPPGKDPVAILDAFTKMAAKHGLRVNPEKTSIVPLTKPMTFCKARFILTGTGKVLRHSAVRSKHKVFSKMNTYKRKLDAGLMTMDDIRASIQSCVAYFKQYDDHRIVVEIYQRFYTIFGEELIIPKDKRKAIRRARKMERLSSDYFGARDEPPKK